MKIAQIIKEAEGVKRIVAIMPGGFHPFHAGHRSLYDWAVEEFGADNVYVAATNDTSTRPFPFDSKEKLAQMAGIPKGKFIQVKSPFNALSYEKIIGNADKTAIVFVRSEKDKTSHPLPDQIRKSDGQMGYLVSYVDKNRLEPATVHGYLAYGPTIKFNFGDAQISSATGIRNSWLTLDDQQKLDAVRAMYPGVDPKLPKAELDKAIGTGVQAEDLAKIKSYDSSMKEANYGRYWCSTDKKWKTRKGPKQSRSS